MDSQKKLYPTWTPESSQIKLTLNPSIKLPSLLQTAGREKTSQGPVDCTLNRRRGRVRTSLTARKERMERIVKISRYSCHYCLYDRHLSEDTSMENYDTESM
ncbi:unnamed protein product [Nyctereutes procyonoides]|uniref:(raccoon dog) hypothetical protein n=1 Tax=Nyctereutes procyonoides TaxID=34880 RepID=A0A811ZRK5_NYCPR|nr:unnamed protein product [Nyctereutes procyonoides]